MREYDLVVVGAGPAGITAAIRAGQLKKNVLLIERNNSIGRKLLLSGKGRCNLTNILSLEEFISKFGKQGDFLRSAFSLFFNQELMDLFRAKGLGLKIERQGRVFPVSDKADSIIEALNQYLLENKVKVLYNKRVRDIYKGKDCFELGLFEGQKIRAGKVVLSTGGVSFKAAGSSGDGFCIAGKFGHKIVPLMPGLVPLKAKEIWLKDVSGMILRNVRLTFISKAKRLSSKVGELHFTPFGVSGALVLDLSAKVADFLRSDKEVLLQVDLKPGLTFKQLENRILRDFKAGGNKKINELLRLLLPMKFIAAFLNLLHLDPESRANQISREKRREMTNLFKSLELHIRGCLNIEEAMVTRGGIAIKEINPRTMESRITPGLYFAGEIIDASAPSGGYNLQQAFSTGYLAGESAAK